MDSSVLVEDGVVWDHEDHDSTIYSNDEITVTLIDNNNESYLTTNEGDDTHYFSVLENTLNMQNMSVTADGETEEGGNEATFYAIEGSDDLCAVSSTRDASGVLRKFRINLRQTESGEYESLPETMQFLASEEEEEEEDDAAPPQPVQRQPIIKQEPLAESELNVAEAGSNSNESDDEQLHVAENEETLTPSTPSFLPIRKMETHLFENSDSEDFEDAFDNNSDYTQYLVENNDEDDYVQRREVLKDFEASNDLEIVQATDSDEDEAENVADYLSELQANSDDFEIVDGPPVTADALRNSDDAPEPVKTHVLNNQPQILNANKKNVQKEGKSPKRNKNLMYYLMKFPEKENVALSASLKRSNSNSNPRSLLKSSFKSVTPKEKEAPKPDRRGVKPKLIQSDAYYNSLAKTTIVQAPIRQQRLPRKQTITPVQRGDEEIIIQEVVVSSNGFIETTQNGVIKSKVPLKASAFVQLSDSEDYQPKSETKRKKRLKKRKVPEIVITDSEDDDRVPEAIEIDLVDESDPEPTNTKRSASTDESASPVGAITRQSVRTMLEANTESSKEPEIITKTKWKCNDCEKVFPSQGSLKTHVQSHCFNQTKKTTNINRHECTKCGEKFKNSILLTKHAKKHEFSKFLECGICKKIFADPTQLASHRRVHVKEQMLKATTLPPQSPKPQAKLSPHKHKCEHCQKLFSTVILLNAHVKSHKLFICSSCNMSFISKLTLESHVTKSCVKKSVSRLSRLPVEPKRCSARMAKGKEVTTLPPVASENRRASVLQLKCEKCPAVFRAHAALYTHKVVKHGANTPDMKQILESSRRKSLRKKIDVYSNIPASKKLQNAHAGFLSKISELY